MGSEPQVLDWDTKHFGSRIARFAAQKPADVRQAIVWARDEGVALLTARIDAGETEIAHALEDLGFRLMDTFVRYHFDLGRKPIPANTGEAVIRPLRPEDVPIVSEIASATFRGYAGHFHADTRLDPERSDALYTEWARNSCTDSYLADEVLVADDHGEVVGFATLKIAGGEGEGVLFGVAPKAQGKGIYRSFIVQSLQWCYGRGLERMHVGTQINNYAVQKVWQRLGFEVGSAGYTFHLWL